MSFHYSKPDGSDLEESDLEYKNKYYGCMCNKGWYGYDCSESIYYCNYYYLIGSCPIGAVDNKKDYDTVSFYKFDKSSPKFPYKVVILNCGEESDPLTQNTDYCRKLTVDVTASSSSKSLRDLIVVYISFNIIF